MKTVTPEQFKEFGPCWLETAAERQRYARVAAMRDEWSALDVLALDGVSNEDKLWAVLREEFIDAPVLHEYACRCAEYALTFVREPDSRSIAAIEGMWKWLRGEISNDDLTAARAVAYAAARAAACAAACAAAWAACDARTAAYDAARAAACDAAWEHEVKLLKELLREVEQ